MLPLILAFSALILFITLMTYLVGRWVSRYVQQIITARIRAIDQIVNQERIPESWIRRQRRRVRRLQTSGADEGRINRLKLRARERAQERLDDLMKYVRETGIADTPETKRMVLQELEQTAKRWRDDEIWIELMDKEPVKEEEAEASS
jgi:hypothetical protein